MAWHDEIQNIALDAWKEKLFKGEVNDLKEIEGAINDYFKETGVKHEEVEVYNPDTVYYAELFDEKIMGKIRPIGKRIRFVDLKCDKGRKEALESVVGYLKEMHEA